MRDGLLLILGFFLATPVWAQVEPLGDEAFQAVASFFSYDAGVPLQDRVVERTETEDFIREKFVFTGARGDRVPGYLAYPADGSGPYDLVLLMHAGASSKDSWWDQNGFERGTTLVSALIERGFAVAALDAQFHGERAAPGDFLPLDVLYFQKEWWARYRDMLVQSTIDYRRALDYLAQREQLRTESVGVLGHSTGGLMAIYLSTLDDRVRTVVACVAALSEEWLQPLDPVSFAPRLDDEAVLLLAGERDPLIDRENSERLAAAVASAGTELAFFESGHRLPPGYIGPAVNWLVQHSRGR